MKITSKLVVSEYLKFVGNYFEKRPSRVKGRHQLILNPLGVGRIIATFHAKPLEGQLNAEHIIGEVHRWPLSYEGALKAAERIDKMAEELGLPGKGVKKRIFSPESSTSPRARKSRRFGNTKQREFFRQTGVIVKLMPRPVEIRKQLKKESTTRNVRHMSDTKETRKLSGGKEDNIE